MNRRYFLHLLGAAPLMAAQRPNIIFLLADDLGYGDLSCFEGSDIQTPNLDRLASSGMRFTRFYSASAVCTPTRAATLTGRYPIRFDIRAHFRDEEEYLSRKAVTLPSLLQKAGYATAHIGKWHLGGLHEDHILDRAHSNPGPLQHGFDHYLCGIEQPSIRGKMVQGRRLYREGARFLLRDDVRVPPVEAHWEDYKIDEGISLLERFHREVRPFFLNLWFDAPHAPYEPPPGPHLSRFQDKAKGDTLLYRAMVSQLDSNIGRLLDKLEALHLTANTLIVFTSDNGPAMQGSAGPWKGRKADLHEGGIRVPMFVSWKGKIPAGVVSDQFTHTTDWFPTLLAAAGVPIPAGGDGRNILPHLLHRKPIPRQTTFWQMDLYKTNWQSGDGPVPWEKPQPYATEIARRGNWKLLAKDGVPVELFDLGADPRETTNVLASNPKLAADLAAELRSWLAAPRDRSWQPKI